jgi:hypothetical protein
VIPTRTLSFQTVPCEGKLTIELLRPRSSTPHRELQVTSPDTSPKNYPDTGGMALAIERRIELS